jgi:hypothetical protein
MRIQSAFEKTGIDLLDNDAGGGIGVRLVQHGQWLLAQGLRPLQIWVPDTRSAAFKSQAHRQSLIVARSAQAQVDQDFIDAISGD